MNYHINNFPAQQLPNTVEMQVGDTRVRATGQTANIFAAFLGVTLAIVVGSALIGK